VEGGWGVEGKGVGGRGDELRRAEDGEGRVARGENNVEIGAAGDGERG